ncbi:MAG: isocitrate lyase/phosphoenolpyruvate mutase family protein [Gemmatimonadales bacterium]
MTSTARKRAAFRRLHETGCFVMPNAWDPGSARYLGELGFAAIASSSAGLAFTLARPDNGVDRDAVLAHLEALVSATQLPVNADFEGGYAVEPAGVAENVELCVATGVAGLSIEDSTGDPASPLFDFELAVARIRAAREAIDRTGPDLVLTGRSEGFLVGRPDLDETIRRLRAYREAGADCLFAPGISTPAQIRAVVEAVAPAPVNLLASSIPAITRDEAEAVGVRRISVGGALARVGWGAVARSARELLDGRFAGLAEAMPHKTLNELFRDGRGSE